MKEFKGRLFRKEVTLKNGNRFDTWFVAYKNVQGSVSYMDVTLSNDVKRGIYALLGKDRHIDVNLLCGQSKEDRETQECFVCIKTDKENKVIRNKEGNPVKKMVIVSLGVENLIKDLDLPSKPREDLTSDF